MDNKVLLIAKNICLQFGEHIILSDVNFQINKIDDKAKIVSLVGTSGKGKTQLLRILAGLTKFDPPPITRSKFMKLVAKLIGHKEKQHVTGEVLIDKPFVTGEVLLGNEMVPVQEGNIGIVFQDYYMPKHLTVRSMWRIAASKNKAFGGDKSKIEEAIDQIATSFELTPHLDKYPVGGQLSGGQKQRANIAMLLLNGSDYILMDEPFSGLDSLMIKKTLKLLRQIGVSQTNKTFIIVSHDLGNCIAISDTIFVLSDKGRTANTGATIVAEIELVKKGLAWNPDVKKMPAFQQTIEEIESYFE